MIKPILARNVTGNSRFIWFVMSTNNFRKWTPFVTKLSLKGNVNVSYGEFVNVCVILQGTFGDANLFSFSIFKALRGE